MSTAIILAGGKSTRMGLGYPPKAMLEINNKTLIQHQLNHLSKLGYKDVIVCLGHRAHLVEWKNPDGMNVMINTEVEPLGTGGAVKQAVKKFLPGTYKKIHVLNVDDLLKPDKNYLLDVPWNRSSILGKPIPYSIWVGDTMFAQNEGVQHVGHSFLTKRFIEGLPDKGSLEKHLALQSKEGHVRVILFKGKWVTVNSPDQLKMAREVWK